MPHFYGRRPVKLIDRIQGLSPSKEKHGSYIIAEPKMGVPIDQCARSQSNVITPSLTGFHHDIQQFSNMAIPTFWIEYVSIFIKIIVSRQKESSMAKKPSYNSLPSKR